VSPIAKLLGIVIPVFVSSAFCLSVPFIILVADAAVLVATVVLFCAERRRIRLAQTTPAHRHIEAV